MLRTPSDGHPIRRRPGGFSLVEVLVAVLVLSVGILGVAGLALGVARESSRSARETARAVVAQRALDSLHRAGFEGASDGRSTLTLDGREWRAAWEVVRETPDLKRVDLRVTGPGDRRRRTFAAARLHRRPAFVAGGSP